MKLITVFLSLCCAVPLAQAECESLPDRLGAHYELSFAQPGQNEPVVKHLALWRSGHQVALEYLDTGVTDVWEKAPNGKLRVVRNFDKDRRAIEYQPVDLNSGRGDSDWGSKWQLIPDAWLSRMQLSESRNDGCEKLEHYRLEEGERKLELAWLPERQLVQSLSEQGPKGTETWRLTTIVSDQEQISQAFISRESYQTTDYVDIGDNEADPFLRKLINLGFVDHGASGFYDADGNHLPGGDAHHH